MSFDDMKFEKFCDCVIDLSHIIAISVLDDRAEAMLSRGMGPQDIGCMTISKESGLKIIERFATEQRSAVIGPHFAMRFPVKILAATRLRESSHVCLNLSGLANYQDVTLMELSFTSVPIIQLMLLDQPN